MNGLCHRFAVVPETVRFFILAQLLKVVIGHGSCIVVWPAISARRSSPPGEPAQQAVFPKVVIALTGTG